MGGVYIRVGGVYIREGGEWVVCTLGRVVSGWCVHYGGW